MTALTAADFPTEFKAKMLHAYPSIAHLPRADAYHASAARKDAAFDLILASVHIGPVCERWWHARNDPPHTVRDALTWNA